MRYDLLNRIKAAGKKFKIFTDYVEYGAMIQFAECLEQDSVIQGALMPDAHSGYVAPIGSVLLTRGTIFPSFVGYDIGCGVSECTIDIDAETLSKEQLTKIKDAILSRVPIGFKRHSKKQPVSRNLRDMAMTEFARNVLYEQGGTQIGTLGGGNHFLEVGKTNDDKLSIVVHSGSRGVGHKIATHHMKIAAIKNTDEQRYIDEFNSKNSDWSSIKDRKTHDKFLKAREEFVYRRVRARINNIEDAYALDIHTKEGTDYIDDMNMALEFALENRWMIVKNTIKAISSILNVKPEKLRFINKNHNHAELFSENCYVHRKGATQAGAGILGVIPGNMVDGSFIVEGLGNKDSLMSSSHGAGRVLSRRKAKDTLDVDEFQECVKHLVSNHTDSNIDEAPKAYKNIFDVMNNQKELVNVIDRVVPIINIKGQ